MDKKFDSEDCNHIASLVAGLCHLLKNSGESEISNSLDIVVRDSRD